MQRRWKMGIITISRGSYKSGREIAEKTAQQLGYDCISREVLLKASKDFDIPEVKLSLAYEPSDSSISYIQRRGRTGRKSAGRFIILAAKDTPDQAIYWSTMHKLKKEKKVLKEKTD